MLLCLIDINFLQIILSYYNILQCIINKKKMKIVIVCFFIYN